MTKEKMKLHRETCFAEAATITRPDGKTDWKLIETKHPRLWKRLQKFAKGRMWVLFQGMAAFRQSQAKNGLTTLSSPAISSPSSARALGRVPMWQFRFCPSCGAEASQFSFCGCCGYPLAIGRQLFDIPTT